MPFLLDCKDNHTQSVMSRCHPHQVSATKYQPHPHLTVRCMVPKRSVPDYIKFPTISWTVGLQLSEGVFLLQSVQVPLSVVYLRPSQLYYLFGVDQPTQIFAILGEI